MSTTPSLAAPNALRCALLLRESNAALAEEALRSQEHALRLESSRRSYTIVNVYPDAGYSGAILDRPAIRDLLDAAERRVFDVVLATEIGRASRGEPYAFYYLRAELRRLGVRLEFLDGHEDDGESEVGALVEGIAVLLPSIERRAIAKRFRRGKERVWSEGFHWASEAPYGYRYVPGGQRGGGHWEIDEEEAIVVRQTAIPTSMCSPTSTFRSSRMAHVTASTCVVGCMIGSSPSWPGWDVPTSWSRVYTKHACTRRSGQLRRACSGDARPEGPGIIHLFALRANASHPHVTVGVARTRLSTSRICSGSAGRLT